MRIFALVVALVACGHPAAAPKRVVAKPSPPPAPAPVPQARIDACADPAMDLAMPDGDVGTIDPAGVVRAISSHTNELRRCYERYLKREARSGRITALMAVRDDGTVAQVQLRGFAGPLDRCLCHVVAHVQFPPPHATAIVSYAMKLSGS